MKKILLYTFLVLTIGFMAAGCTNAGDGHNDPESKYIGTVNRMEIEEFTTGSVTCYVAAGMRKGGISCIK